MAVEEEVVAVEGEIAGVTVIIMDGTIESASIKSQRIMRNWRDTITLCSTWRRRRKRISGMR